MSRLTISITFLCYGPMWVALSNRANKPVKEIAELVCPNTLDYSQAW